MYTPVVLLNSQQPAENHLQYTHGASVVQCFSLNGFYMYQYPKEWHKGWRRLFVLIYQTLRAMQTCELRSVGRTVIFLRFFFKTIHSAAVPSQVRATTRTGYIVTSSDFTKWRPHLGTRYVDISRLFSGR